MGPQKSKLPRGSIAISLLVEFLVIRSSLSFLLTSTSTSSSVGGVGFRILLPPDMTAPPTEDAAITTTTGGGPVARAFAIGSILWDNLFGPAALTLLQQGLPIDANEFWARTITVGRNSTSMGGSLMMTNAERAALAAERAGPTFAKFGQALSARSDIVPPVLAEALSKLQDDMEATFDTATAKEMIQRELAQKGVDAKIVKGLIETLGEVPVGKASIAQVYKAELANYGPVAIKLQRPGIRDLVQQDTVLLRRTAEFLESLPPILPTSSKTKRRDRLVAMKLVDAVDEFMSRVTEELDYHAETKNMAKFASLYSHTNGTCKNVNVVVPEVLADLCTENVIVMEWIEGTKVTDFSVGDDSLAENILILESASAATLTQLFETGVMHADPHSGNLLKVRMDDGKVMLGYLDYGMVSTIPEQVRDGLVCAIAQMVFAKNVEAVVLLFTELQLLRAEILEDPTERTALIDAMEEIMTEVMVFPERVESGETPVPDLNFDSLLGGLSLLVARFEFQLPPYFINNARALATLEGITKKLNPKYKTMTEIYPVALRRIFNNPSGSPVVEATLLDLAKDPFTGVATIERLAQLIGDSARLSGNTRLRVVKDILRTKGGIRMSRKIMLEVFRGKLTRKKSRRRLNTGRPFFKL